MPRSHEILPEGTVLAGKFRVIRLLGEGGMGVVYEIEHELTKHRRALKLLHSEMREHPGVVERFLREASAAGRIGNPHIVEVFDAGTLDTGEPYVVLELLAGETLSARLEREQRIDLPTLVELAVQACDGVEAAHAAGIVHRDLKPDNLYLVAHGDGPPFVKILDFGVSKFDSELTGGFALTREGTTLGTPLYMPPEQVRGQQDIDRRADVYALGVILYECAAGAPPFNAGSLPQLYVLIHEGKATPLGELCPELPGSFTSLVARAMAVDREARIPTARELAAGLLAVPEASALAQTAPGPAPIMTARPPPSPSTPPPALAVSARGVSTPAPARGHAGPALVGGVVACAAAVLVGAAVWMGFGSSTHRVVDAITSPPTPPAVPPAVPSAVASSSVVPLAVASGGTPPTSASAVVSGPDQAPPRPVASTPAPHASGPRPAPAASTRAEGAGLAKDLF